MVSTLYARAIANSLILRWGLLFVIGTGIIGAIPASAFARSTGPSPVALLKKRLKNNGFPPHFIKLLLKNYDESRRDQVIKLNVLGFLLSPDYSGHITPTALQRCREFINEHQQAFTLAEKKYGVKKEIIAALLWVESRFGENHGTYHVASVYLSLLQGEHREVLANLMKELEKKQPHPSKAIIAKTKKRVKIKGRWAIGELWALYKMNKRQSTTVAQLKGSYSGAFGYSQFLPSSFLEWAASSGDHRVPDLYNADDAIVSVANYLKKNGYKTGKEASYRKALFKYNMSTDYGDTILKLASNLSKASLAPTTSL